MRTRSATQMGPSCLSLLTPFPIKNCAPPLENWIIVGELTSLAAARAALTELVPIQFTAGSAKSLRLGIVEEDSFTSSPKRTPARNCLLSPMIERIEFIVPESRTGNSSGRGCEEFCYHTLVFGSSMNVSQRAIYHGFSAPLAKATMDLIAL